MSDPRPRLLIIGARGFVGEHLALRAAERYQVVRADLRASSDEEIALDITRPDSVRAAFDRARPSVVALLAALSDIDQCEREPELAEIVNVNGPEFIARECARMGARLVYTSSAAVFDGSQHGYLESVPPTPVSVYGRTKAAAEGRITVLLPDAIILRIALVLGYSLRPGTNALLSKLQASFRAGKPVVVPTYEHRNPIDVGTLCDLLLDLVKRPDARGVFHIGATDSLSRYELVRRLAARMGYSPDLVTPREEPIAGRAQRGLDHFLISERLARYTERPLPDCATVLERACYAVA
jgi:dTDP-4-dehydrorhamnose reductase